MRAVFSRAVEVDAAQRAAAAPRRARAIAHALVQKTVGNTQAANIVRETDQALQQSAR